MSMTFTETASRDTAAYGGFVDAIGGVAAIALAIVGLAGVRPEMMVAIATIVFGAALLIQAGAVLSEYARIVYPAGAGAVPIETFTGGGLSSEFLAGAGGVVLGVLALLNIVPTVLTSVAVIAFGSALVLSASSIWRLHQLEQARIPAQGQAVNGAAILAHEMAAESAGVQSLAGLAAIVLGILSVAGMNAGVLTLAALLALGATLIMTGSSLSATVLGLMRPTNLTTPAE
jgi:hypothetical protein